MPCVGSSCVGLFRMAQTVERKPANFEQSIRGFVEAKKGYS